jgi:hypothetical protein
VPMKVRFDTRGSRHRLPVHGASRSSASSVCRQARRRPALRPNAAPSATTAITSTSTSTGMPATAVSVAGVECPPITNGASAAPTHRRCGRVLCQRLTLSPLPAQIRAWPRLAARAFPKLATADESGSHALRGVLTRKVGVVARNAGSAADRELTARLAARGLTGSGARYERWRRADLLPRHERHWAGQGRGSVSVLSPATVEIAAALARHAQQGRDLRAAVVAWFFEAGRPALPGQLTVPEPPDVAVAEALAWAVRTSPEYRMLQRARSAVTEAQKDDFYATAAEQARPRSAQLAGWTRRLCAKRC